MELWPAIDLRGGRCVRLLQGDYDRETIFGDDPVAMARGFLAAGARRLHIVDLDGARDGVPTQADLVAKMVGAAGVPCQLGGGVRSLETIDRYLAAGVDRVVVGSVAVESPALLVEMTTAFPGKIVLGLDARDGRVAVRGWLETTSLTAIDVARRHADLPLAAIVFTDIATDGMLSGPNLPALEAMVRSVPVPIVASGGIASADDIRRVASTGAAGCIVGRALYENAVTILAAVEAAGDAA
jgi:phosphoribosylformimino-5-aminoimidazole carboxamide ribotide isomerase